jgi:hypothetical protein
MMSFMAELLSLYKNRNMNHIEQVHLVWVNPTSSPFEMWFPQLLGDLATVGDPFHLHLYVTGSKQSRDRLAAASSAGKLPSTLRSRGQDDEASSSSVQLTTFNPITHVPATIETPATESDLSVQVRNSDGAAVQLALTVGRPDFETLLPPISTGRKAGTLRCGVLSCGVPGMVEAVRASAIPAGFFVHEESFLF